MTIKEEQARRAYVFFINAEKTNKNFTISDVCEASGWGESTVKTYLSKKWSFFLEKVPSGLRVNKLSSQVNNVDSFLRIHSQKANLASNLLRPSYSEVVDNLIDKSRESCLLAVQIYNNPLVSFRTPGFIVQMIIAYTALFHAIFEHREQEYWSKQRDGSDEIIDGDKHSWAVSKCIQEFYGENSSAEKENLIFCVKIRNKIEHRFIPELDLTFSGKCQALIMNFEQLLVENFGSFFSLARNLSLALQFSSYSPEQGNALRNTHKHEYETVRKYADMYEEGISSEILQSPAYSFRAFLIPKIGNHAKSSDIAIEFVKYDSTNPKDMENYDRQVALIKEKRVSVANPGQYTPGKVVDAVKQRTNNQTFKMTDHTKAWKILKVRPSGKNNPGLCQTEYCHFDDAFEQFIYTEKWVELLCAKVNNSKELEKIRNFRPSK